MKIALLNAWENNAEFELQHRIEVSAARLGHTTSFVRNSSEIIASEPDVVISLSFHFPKLTDHLTLGTVWSPASTILSRPDFLKNLLTFDGYLTATPALERVLEDVHVGSGRVLFTSPFVPTSFSTPFQFDLKARRRMVAYAGTNWERKTGKAQVRYQELLLELSRRDVVDIYGPTGSWTGFASYRGEVPFDGRSMLDTYKGSGAVLCLHAEGHYLEGVPTMRVFEAAAASSVAICDRNTFLEDRFGDSVLYIDRELPPRDIADQVENHLNWIFENPADARAKAEKAHQVFNREFSYEALLATLPEFVEKVRRERYHSIPVEKQADKVNLIVRCGHRPVSYLERCLTSIAGQTYRNVEVIVIKHNELPGFDQVIERFKRSLAIRVIETSDIGPKSRRLWLGLKAVEGDFFGLLDDDDTIHSNHLMGLVRALNTHKDALLAYSGTVRVWDGEDILGNDLWRKVEPWPKTDRHSDEDRYLLFYRAYSKDRLLTKNDLISSPCYICRSSALTPEMLQEPEVETAEDFCLLLMLAAKGSFKFTFDATAEWRWSKSLGANATFRKKGQRGLNSFRNRLRSHLDLLLADPERNYNPQFDMADTRERDVQYIPSPDAVSGGGRFAMVPTEGRLVRLIGVGSWQGYHRQQKIVISGKEEVFIAQSRTLPDIHGVYGKLSSERFNTFVVDVLLPAGDDVHVHITDRTGEIRQMERDDSLLNLNLALLETNSRGFRNVDFSQPTPARWMEDEGIIKMPHVYRGGGYLFIAGAEVKKGKFRAPRVLTDGIALELSDSFARHGQWAAVYKVGEEIVSDVTIRADQQTIGFGRDGTPRSLCFSHVCFLDPDHGGQVLDRIGGKMSDDLALATPDGPEMSEATKSGGSSNANAPFLAELAGPVFLRNEAFELPAYLRGFEGEFYNRELRMAVVGTPNRLFLKFRQNSGLLVWPATGHRDQWGEFVMYEIWSSDAMPKLQAPDLAQNDTGLLAMVSKNIGLAVDALAERDGRDEIAAIRDQIASRLAILREARSGSMGLGWLRRLGIGGG